MVKVLVTVDGSKNSLEAVKKARDLVKLSKGKISLLHVINNLSASPYLVGHEEIQAIDRVFEDQAELILEDALKLIEGTDIEVETIIRHGDPGSAIIDLAEDEDFDLIVMGSRGLNALSRAVLGSVSNKVLNHVNTSVLIVK